MKRAKIRFLMIRGLISVLVFAAFPVMSFSQCEPDVANCIDTGDPGQMCPSVLPDGFVDEYYEQIITILTPESGSAGGLNINIHKLKLESIENLPPGLEYSSVTNEFFANETYCVSLFGTPERTGVFKLKITVTPYIRILGIPVPWGEYVDSTSIVMNIGTSTLIDLNNNYDFSLINAYPNPFVTSTRIGFTNPSSAQSDLKVYNTLGGLLYEERIISSAGENYFNFNGQELPPGYYIYSIVRENKAVMGRIIKSR